MAAEELYVGLICGTSLDGIDAVLLRCGTKQEVRVIETHCKPLSAELKKRLQRISLAEYGVDQDPIEELGSLHREVGLRFGETASELLKLAGVEKERVRAIGSHGITIRHRPEKGFTMQIGDPNVVAVTTGIDVVGDLRGKDVALGGQGAPLVCTFHQAVFATDGKRKCILNIGGIANGTILNGRDIQFGFDTGPGNGLLDAWIRKHLGQAFDSDGSWARSGNLDEELLALLLNESYFSSPPPKSTGKELFNLAWLDNKLRRRSVVVIDPVDVQCTLAHFTAKTIADAVRPFCLDEIFICGGGAHNSYLMDLIGRYYGVKAIIRKTDELGVGCDWVEAAAFAWMAAAYLEDRPANSPAVTGATGSPASLGALYKAN